MAIHTLTLTLSLTSYHIVSHRTSTATGATAAAGGLLGLNVAHSTEPHVGIGVKVALEVESRLRRTLGLGLGSGVWLGFDTIACRLSGSRSAIGFGLNLP